MKLLVQEIASMRTVVLRSTFGLVLGCAVGILSPAYGGEPESTAAKSIDFNREIRGILSDNCFQCHGPDAAHREADLRLDTEAGAKADLGGYRAIDSDKPAESALIERITADDPDMRMPPEDSGKELTRVEIDLLRTWIEQGATWSEHWAYATPRRHELPQVADAAWPSNWVDHFVLAELEIRQLAPSPETDRVTLLRRVTFDLTGLPPTPEEVANFLADESPEAYERVVDRLLESPHYGERMAIYWLDLVRYADTVGYHGDQDHNSSPYRDYVINAFNDNMPLDQFTVEQLAGDLLPDPTLEQRVATAYNRLLQTSHEGGVQPKEYLAIYAADRVRNVSAVWMGATMGCAQCHDHKYDPYTAKDFYSMVAFFADIDEAKHFTAGSNALPTARPPEIPVLDLGQREEIAEIDAQLARLETRIKAADTVQADGTAGAASEEPPGSVNKEPADVENSADADAAKDTDALKQQIQSLTQRREAIQKSARLCMVTASIEPRTIRLLPRGNWLDDSGEVVQPAVPEFLGSVPVSDRRATRLDLARWLTAEDQGVGSLTARVFANRFWYLCFGVGLSRVLDDLGVQGEAPMNGPLLDSLAVELIEHDWDVKHMMRLLVTSSAYRQSSTCSEALLERDPYNQLTARQSSFRLPAEMVRDAALDISGLLVRKVGGASVRPYQPEGYYRHLNFPTRTYKQHDDSRQWRRGVYVHWQRQFLHPMLKAFDAPTREECTASRPRSNTPLAALTLLNDPTFVEASRAFAERILREADPTTEARIELAFRLAVSRPVDPQERAMLTRLLELNLEQYKADPQAAREVTSVGLTPLAQDLDPVELAAWTAVARAVLNLNETITRN
jgi:mono/diheme cytochrome c family protein